MSSPKETSILDFQKPCPRSCVGKQDFDAWKHRATVSQWWLNHHLLETVVFINTDAGNTGGELGEVIGSQPGCITGEHVMLVLHINTHYTHHNIHRISVFLVQ